LKKCSRGADKPSTLVFQLPMAPVSRRAYPAFLTAAAVSMGYESSSGRGGVAGNKRVASRSESEPAVSLGFQNKNVSAKFLLYTRGICECELAPAPGKNVSGAVLAGEAAKIINGLVQNCVYMKLKEALSRKGYKITRTGARADEIKTAAKKRKRLKE